MNIPVTEEERTEGRRKGWSGFYDSELPPSGANLSQFKRKFAEESYSRIEKFLELTGILKNTMNIPVTEEEGSEDWRIGIGYISTIPNDPNPGRTFRNLNANSRKKPARE